MIGGRRLDAPRMVIVHDGGFGAWSVVGLQSFVGALRG